MSKRKHSTRSSTLQFLVGQPSPDFPEGILPTYKDVLRDVLWKKAKLGSTLPTKEIVSCHLGRKTDSSICQDPMGCVSKEVDSENYCTVEKVREKWRQAGIETVSDRVIRDNIVAVTTEFQRKIKKRRDRQSNGAVEEREVFKSKLEKCFNVSSKDAQKKIEKDKKRTAADKVRDLEFLADQLTYRKMMFTVMDKKYETVVMSAQMRKLAKLKRIQKEDQRAAEIVLLPGFEADSLTEAAESQDDGFGDIDSHEIDTVDEEIEEMRGSDSVFKSPTKKRPRLRARKIRGKTVTLQIPLDIISKTSAAASRLKLSAGQHCGIV